MSEVGITSRTGCVHAPAGPEARKGELALGACLPAGVFGMT